MENLDDNQFKNAIASKNFKTLIPFLNRSNQQLYDDTYIVDQFIKNKWSLHDVAKTYNYDLIKLFLESDDSINVNSNDYHNGGQTELHKAVYYNDVYLVKLLLEHNADPNSLNRHSCTPVGRLYEDGRVQSNGKTIEILKILFDRGAKPTTTTANYEVLQITNVLCFGNDEEVEFVLKLDIDFRARYNEEGNTVLHYLARNYRINSLTNICVKDFDVNVRNDRQETPLFMAIELGNDEVIEFLLSNGADVNAMDVDNNTPLYFATVYYELDLNYFMISIKHLLQYGADIRAVLSQDRFSALFDKFLRYEVEDKAILCELMLEHVVLHKMNGTIIPKLIQNTIDFDRQFRKYFDYCNELLPSKIYESRTLLELLSCKQQKLVSFMSNADFVRDVKNFIDVLKLQTVFYGNWLQKRFDEASRTVTLRNSAAIVICKIMTINYNGYSFIVDSILSYLDDQDLIALLNI